MVSFTSNLIYRAQPGALNEHFADVFGILVRKWSNRTRKKKHTDWLIGRELWAIKSAKLRGIRDMEHPGTAHNHPDIGTDPQPAHMSKLYTGMADSQGVHINSGIPNRAFVLAAQAIGGHPWEKTRSHLVRYDDAVDGQQRIRRCQTREHPGGQRYLRVGLRHRRFQCMESGGGLSRAAIMKVQYTRSGGFLGAVSSCELDTDSLPAEFAEELQALVAKSGLVKSQELLSTKARDLRQYTVRIRKGGRAFTVVMDGSAVPAKAKPLLALLGKHAKPGLP